jgi:tellurite resistance protein TerC
LGGSLLDSLLLSAPGWAWLGFLAFVVLMLAMDLGIFNRKVHVPSFKEAAIWSGVWIGLALIFNSIVWMYMGRFKGIEWFTGYVLEKSLSVDNLFVFVMVFQSFGVEIKDQHRILYWGILGALIFRALMILGGTALLNRFEWMMYVFGAFLIWTGLKMFFEKGQLQNHRFCNSNGVGRLRRNKASREERVDGEMEGADVNGVLQSHHNEETPDTSEGAIVRVVRRLIPFDPQGGHQHFLSKKNGKHFATPMLLVLVVIELTDMVFAVDSIPAILAITRDVFVVFTSNIFAILGLRSLYFLLAKMMDRFHYLKTGLAAILAFVGIKMCVAHWAKAKFGISDSALIVFSLIFISAVLIGSIAISLLSTSRPKDSA